MSQKWLLGIPVCQSLCGEDPSSSNFWQSTTTHFESSLGIYRRNLLLERAAPFSPQKEKAVSLCKTRSPRSQSPLHRSPLRRYLDCAWAKSKGKWYIEDSMEGRIAIRTYILHYQLTPHAAGFSFCTRTRKRWPCRQISSCHNIASVYCNYYRRVFTGVR